MLRKQGISGVAAAAMLAVGILGSTSLAADDTPGTAAASSEEGLFRPVFAEALKGGAAPEASFADAPDDGYGRQDFALRFGWWFTHQSGSPSKVGEYQSLNDSPFVDVDWISSNGLRTLNFSATETDNDGTQFKGYFFGPRMSATLDFERFLRRFERDPFDNFDNAIPQGSTPVLARTMNDVGQDYAIRVQEFNAKFKGRLNENLRWRVEVWGMKKEGERQATALGHCYNVGGGGGNRCHQVSQVQTIDWTTTEVKPVLEAKLGPVTLEYSRTMRAFDQNDGVVTRQYTATNHPGWQITGVDIPYGFVTENFTQIDRLKASSDLNDFNHFYGSLYSGNTHNEYRDTHRFFSGLDMRLTNDRINGVSVTGYAKVNNESGQLPTTFPESSLIQGGDSIANYDHPVSHERTAFGVKGRWRPHDSGLDVSRGLAFTGGYEYNILARDYAIFNAGALDPPSTDFAQFVQGDTKSSIFNVGVQRRWSSKFDTFVRYKHVTATDPLFGLREISGDVNTNQPTSTNTVELGGTWMPSASFLLTATVGLENAHHFSEHLNENHAYDLTNVYRPDPLPNPRTTEFDETSYPITLTAWYALTEKWSFSVGYARFSNYIDQLITLGDDYWDGTINVAARQYATPDAAQAPWRFWGQANVFNVGGAYAWSKRLTLRGGFEFVRSTNTFAVDAPALAWNASGTNNNATNAILIAPDWSTLAYRSAVIVETTKLTAGVDYLFSQRVSTFFRYNYFDYNDQGATAFSGTSHWFLAGMNAMF
jgi:hypothetical protein